jgi:DNA polymerase-3 subunit epsilon
MILELQRDLVFFDLETTGLDPDRDRIVEIGLVRLRPGGERAMLVERVDPGIDIPDAATKVHGIATGEVRGLFGKPRLAQIAPRLLEFIGDADLAGFNNLAFDNRLLARECERHAIPLSFDGRRVLDAKVVFHAKETSWDRFLMGPRTLTAAVRHYLGRELDGAHSAGKDADATADVLLAQLARYLDLPRDVPGLHVLCAQMREQLEARAQSA